MPIAGFLLTYAAMNVSLQGSSMNAALKFTAAVEKLQQDPDRQEWGTDSLAVDFLQQRKPFGRQVLEGTQRNGRVISLVNEGDDLVCDMEAHAAIGDLNRVGLVVFAHVLHDCTAEQRRAIFDCLHRTAPQAVVTFTDYALRGLPLDSVMSCFQSQQEQRGIYRKGLPRFLLEHCQFTAAELRELLSTQFRFCHTEPLGAGRMLGIGADHVVHPGMSEVPSEKPEYLATPCEYEKTAILV